jgi:hypothetical protein
MPSTPRGRNAATALAVILAIVLALVWLRSSAGSAPAVPAGLSVGTVPTAPETTATEPAPRPADGIGRRAVQKRAPKRRAAVRGHGKVVRHYADRTGGREDARARREARARARRGTAGEAGGQDPPAARPAPVAGSGAAVEGGAVSGGTAGGTSAGSGADAPEFALD